MILSPEQKEILECKFNGWMQLGGLSLVKEQLPRFGKEKQYHLECLIQRKVDEIMKIQPLEKDSNVGK